MRDYDGTETGTHQIKLVYQQTVRKLKARQSCDIRRHQYEQAVLQHLGDSFIRKHYKINYVIRQAKEEKRKFNEIHEYYRLEQLRETQSNLEELHVRDEPTVGPSRGSNLTDNEKQRYEDLHRETIIRLRKKFTGSDRVLLKPLTLE